MHLFSQSKKGEGEAKVEILVPKTMITPEEDLNPRGETRSAFIVRKCVI